MDLQRNSHHVSVLWYHFVWIPKYRYKAFIESYRGALEKIDYNYNIEIVELEMPVDRIHYGSSL